VTQVDWAESFGGRLARLRHDRGLTQEQLADLSGLSVRAISSLECGARHPRRMTVERIATGLQLAPPDRRRLVDASARPSRLTPASPSPLAAAGPVSSPRLVGRHRETAELCAHLDGDGPPLLALTGEPGIGKSRLLAEADRLATAAGLPLLHGACRRGGTIDPELLRYASRPPAAATGRVVLLLDDMQWADSATAEVLGHLVERMGVRLRVVIAVRSGDLPPRGSLAQRLGDLARVGRVGHRALPPLSPAEALELAGRPGIVERAGGLPLFLVELAAATGGIPPHLRLAVRHQLAELPDDARALLQRMAAGPVVTSAERLLRGDDTAHAILTALEPAIRRRIVDDTVDGFRFRYPLFREVLLAELGPSRRSLLRHALAVLATFRPLGHVKVV
jgi:transcriptional regulator with XRE-family HTH domain